ncbi:MAG: DUF4157 domain-containing protein [Cyanobacteria bacterium J06592_8]
MRRQRRKRGQNESSAKATPVQAQFQPRSFQDINAPSEKQSTSSEKELYQEKPRFDFGSIPLFSSHSSTSPPQLQNHPSIQMKMKPDRIQRQDEDQQEEIQMKPEPNRSINPVFKNLVQRDEIQNVTLKIPFQTKLTIGAPGDPYEQEADRIAQNVVQQINTSTPDVTPSNPTTVQREIVEEQEGDDEGTVQMKPVIQLQELAGGAEAPSGLESSINRAKGSGHPLDVGLQRSMGQAMGADFSRVKVHTGSTANQLSQSIQAKAFTTGEDVFFKSGEYQPSRRSGQELIAHELTHVVQQNGSQVSRKSHSKSPAQGNLTRSSQAETIPRQVTALPQVSRQVIQRKLLTSTALKQLSQVKPKSRAKAVLATVDPSTFNQICTALDQYHAETNTQTGANRLIKRKEILESLLANHPHGLIALWMRSPNRPWSEANQNPNVQVPEEKRRIDAAKETVLLSLKTQAEEELSKVEQELTTLDTFDQSKESSETKSRELSADDETQIPDINRIWSPEEYTKYIINAANSAGSITNHIHKVLKRYHEESLVPYRAAIRAVANIQKPPEDIDAASNYMDAMETVNQTRARMAKWSADLESLATSWLTGHEDEASRKYRYTGMLKFLAQIQYGRKNLDTQYPPLQEFPEKGLLNDVDPNTDVDNLMGYDEEEQETIATLDEKTLKLSEKYYGTFDSVFEKFAPMIDAAVPQHRDKSQIKAEFAIPVGAGIGILSLTGLFKAENKEAGKLKIRGEFSMGGGVSDPTGWLAKIVAELGGYFEAQGKNSINVMKQLSYGMYRRFRESSVIPRSLTNTLWGKGRSAAAKYKSSEAWAGDVEENVLGDTKKPDDVYVDTGALLRGQIKGGDDALGLGFKVEHQENTGKRYNKNTIEALAGGLGQQQKYAKVKELGGYAPQEARGKHYAMRFTEVEGQFEIPQLIGIKLKYKHSREYSGANDRQRQGMLNRLTSNLVKTKHEFIVTSLGALSNLVQMRIFATKLPDYLKKVARQADQEDNENAPPQKNNAQRAGIAYDAVSSMCAGFGNVLTAGAYDGYFPEGTFGLDIAHELKWKNGKIAEKKTEVDWRNVQSQKVDIGVATLSTEKRGAFVGYRQKYKMVEVHNPENSNEIKSVPDYVYKAIEADMTEVDTKKHPPVEDESDSQAEARKQRIKAATDTTVFGPRLQGYQSNLSGEWKESTEQ